MFIPLWQESCLFVFHLCVCISGEWVDSRFNFRPYLAQTISNMSKSITVTFFLGSLYIMNSLSFRFARDLKINWDETTTDGINPLNNISPIDCPAYHPPIKHGGIYNLMILYQKFPCYAKLKFVFFEPIDSHLTSLGSSA